MADKETRKEKVSEDETAQIGAGNSTQADDYLPAEEAGVPLDQYGNALPLYPPVNNPNAPSQQTNGKNKKA